MMLDTHSAATLRVRSSHSAVSRDAADALLDAIGPVEGARVLLVGPGTLDLMCAAIRRGCEGVTSLGVSDRPEAGSADLAFVSPGAAYSCALGGKADSVPARMMRALSPLGTLVVPIDPEGGPVAATAQALRSHGFSAIRTRTSMDGRVLLFAERPLHGALGGPSGRA